MGEAAPGIPLRDASRHAGNRAILIADAVSIGEMMIKIYDDVLPRIDSAL